MKLSSKGLYGVQAIFDLAFHSEGGSAQIRDISDRQDIPPRFLEQVFQDLRKAGLVTSKRGPKGGYQLALSADRIRIGDIIRALEGPVQLLPSGRSRGEAGVSGTTSQQVAEDVFRGLSASIEACLDGVTVAEMCHRADALGLSRRRPPAHGYAI